MAGKLTKAGDSKLARRGEQAAGDVPPSAGHVPSPRGGDGGWHYRSFRLAERDMQRLKEITERLEGETGQRVKEVQVVRGLLLLGSKTASRKLLTTIRDALWDVG